MAGDVKLTTENELDLCQCGDPRRDHADGHGACRHNKPRDLTHGYKDCLAFRLSRPHDDASLAAPRSQP